MCVRARAVREREGGRSEKECVCVCVGGETETERLPVFTLPVAAAWKLESAKILLFRPS